MRARLRRDHGQAATEYTGLIALIALLVLAVLVIVPPLAPALRDAVCRALNLSCASDPANRLDIQCVTERRDRDHGIGITLFSGHAEARSGDRVEVFGNGRTNVLLWSESRLGVKGGTGARARFDVGTGKMSAGTFLSGMATAGGRVGYVYEFENEQAAQEHLDSRRGGWRRALSLVGGVSNSSVEEGIRWLGRKVGIGEDAPTPRTVVVRLDERAEGELGYGGGRANAAGRLSQDAGAEVHYDLQTGERTFIAAVGGGGGASAWFPVIGGSAGAEARGIMSVKFDENGEPTRFTFTGEALAMGGLEGGGGAENAVLRRLGVTAGNIGGGGSSAAGQRQQVSVTLDLTDPANRRAFDQVFTTPGGVVVAPRTDVSGEDAGTFLREFGDDGVVVVTNYDEQGQAGSGGGGGEREVGARGGSGLTFGGGYDSSNRERVLDNARILDMAARNPSFQPFTACGP